jgi:hypothetical protein
LNSPAADDFNLGYAGDLDSYNNAAPAASAFNYGYSTPAAAYNYGYAVPASYGNLYSGYNPVLAYNYEPRGYTGVW